MTVRRRPDRVRIAVLADTHIPDFADALPAALLRELQRADLILHAGDVSAAFVLDELAGYAPVRAALGNNDGQDVQAWGAAEEIVIQIGAVRIAMVHDSGRRPGRGRRLRRRFPHADVAIFGHSHIPVNEVHEGLRLLNPGSPTWKRRQPRPTFAWLGVVDSSVNASIVPLVPSP